jgi:hypothetical protein
MHHSWCSNAATLRGTATAFYRQSSWLRDLEWDHAAPDQTWGWCYRLSQTHPCYACTSPDRARMTPPWHPGCRTCMHRQKLQSPVQHAGSHGCCRSNCYQQNKCRCIHTAASSMGCPAGVLPHTEYLVDLSHAKHAHVTVCSCKSTTPQHTYCKPLHFTNPQHYPEARIQRTTTLCVVRTCPGRSASGSV